MEVSPLPEPIRGAAVGHHFEYAETVPMRVQGTGIAFNIVGKAQPFPEAKFTNHCIEVRIASTSSDAPQTNDTPVFSTCVTPGKSVSFSANGKYFSFTPTIINVGAHPTGNSTRQGQ